MGRVIWVLMGWIDGESVRSLYFPYHGRFLLALLAGWCILIGDLLTSLMILLSLLPPVYWSIGLLSRFPRSLILDSLLLFFLP